MKKSIVWAVAMAFMVSVNAMAQDEQNSEKRDNSRQAARTEMIKHRTDQMVKTYGLSEEQSQQLQELNTKYADKLRLQRPGMRQRPGQPRGMRPQTLPRDTAKRAKMDNPDRMKQRMEEMKKTREAYDAELEKIMTADQFKAYKADAEKRAKEGRRGPKGNRQHRNFQ
jgi:Spy/CpxP family protein refolding chaperone